MQQNVDSFIARKQCFLLSNTFLLLKTLFKMETIFAQNLLKKNCLCMYLYICGYRLMVNSLSSTQMIWVRFPLSAQDEGVHFKKCLLCLLGEIGKHDRLKICSLYGYRFKSDSKHTYVMQSKACSCFSWCFKHCSLERSMS